VRVVVEDDAENNDELDAEDFILVGNSANNGLVVVFLMLCNLTTKFS
jgi:hypothetical protein